MIQELVYTALAPLVASAVYPGVAPDGTLPPYIVYSRVSSVPENTLDPTQPIQQTRLQVDVYGATYVAAQQLAAAVTAAMLGLNTAAGPPTGVSVVQVLELDQYEGDIKYHRVIQDYSLWHYT